MEGSLRDISKEEHEQPAIGVIATRKNLDAVARIAMRAATYDRSVLVAHRDDIDPESLGIDNGNTIWISPSERTSSDDEPLRQLLDTTARACGFPGLIFHERPEELINYKQIDAERGLDYVAAAPVQLRAERGSTLVVIPAYNEEQTIATVVEMAKPHADEVLVVDDGSSDRTVSEARKAGAETIEHGANRGYGAALKTAFEEGNRRGAASLIVIDGDGQHDTDDIPKLQNALDEGADVVIGSRFAHGAETDLPLYRWIGVTVINVLTNLSMGVVRPGSWVHDTQCGFRAYGPRAIESLANDGNIGDSMDASTDILYHAHANSYVIREVGTTVDYDVANASTQNPISHGLTLVKNILRTVEMERPVTAFGLPGATTVIIGLGIGYWTLSNFLSTGTMSLALTLIAIFCVLAGVLASITAIILHALSVHFQHG